MLISKEFCIWNGHFRAISKQDQGFLVLMNLRYIMETKLCWSIACLQLPLKNHIGIAAITATSKSYDLVDKTSNECLNTTPLLIFSWPPPPALLPWLTVQLRHPQGVAYHNGNTLCGTMEESIRYWTINQFPMVMAINKCSFWSPRLYLEGWPWALGGAGAQCWLTVN